MKYRMLKASLGVATLIATMLVIGPAAHATSAPKINRGGALTVITINSTWPGLDPATDASDSADTSYLDAIYGQLFDLTGNKQIVPDMATGYKFSNHNETVTITLRQGIKFSDGTPFNAQAVAANITRVLLPQYACICDSDWKALSSVTTKGKYTVILHLSTPSTTIVEAFVGEAPNWTVDPTALASEPEPTFAQNPVGAGPFTVVSNVASSQLTLTKNPHYWRAGHPYLNTLTFITTPVDQTAYAALQAGSAQLALGISTVALIQEAPSQFNLKVLPGVNNQLVIMNTAKAPFNNVLAREALYYSINPKQLVATLFPNFAPTEEGDDGPGGLFYEKTIPGYPAYNLAKAQSLVQQIGGLSFNVVGGTSAATQLIFGALQNQWAQAGIQATFTGEATATEVAQLSAGNWQASTQQVGGVDPDVGIQSLNNRVGLGPQSGVHDPTLIGLINQSQELLNPTARKNLLEKIYKYVTANYFAPTLWAVPTAVISSKSLTPFTSSDLAPGAAAFSPYIEWEDVSLK